MFYEFKYENEHHLKEKKEKTRLMQQGIGLILNHD